MEKSALGSSKVEQLTDIDSLANNQLVYFDGGRFLYQLNFFSPKKINFKYDIFSKEITLLSNPDYYEIWIKPKGGFAASDHTTVVKAGDYFYEHDPTNNQIVRFKVDNPAEYEVHRAFGPRKYPRLTCIYSTIPVSCDSLMMMGRVITERDSFYFTPTWKDVIIDPNTFEYRFLECNLLTIEGNSFVSNFSDAVYLKAPTCELTLDADADDSRFKGDTTYQVQTCGLYTPVHLVDEDVEIRSNGGRIAWCKIKLSGVMEPDKETLVFNALQGYNLTRPSPSEWLLSPADKFDLHALEKVLSDLQYQHTGPLATEGKREVSIEVKLTSGQSTSLTMQVLVNTKPTWAGADVEHHVCLDGRFLNPDFYLDPMAVAGGDYVADGISLSNGGFEVSDTGMLMLQYLAGPALCRDTSILMLDIHFNPEVKPVDIKNVDHKPGITLDPGITTAYQSIHWKPRYNLSCDQCEHPEVLRPINQEYTVTVVTGDGCFSTAPLEVQFNDYYLSEILLSKGRLEEYVLYLAGGRIVTYELDVYDKLGRLVWRTDKSSTGDPSQGWSCRNAAQGIYFFRLQIEDDAGGLVKTGKFLVL